MRRLEKSGKYFSDEEMKTRDPLLYEEMIGQFLTDEEAAAMAQDDISNNSQLSQLLLRHLQSMQNNELYEFQVEQQVRSVLFTFRCYFNQTTCWWNDLLHC